MLREKVGVEDDGTHQSDAPAYLPDERVRSELAQTREERGLELERSEHEAVGGEEVEVRERSRAARGVTAVGGAVREHLSGFLPERLGDVRRDDDAAQREVAARDALGEDDQVRHEAEPLD